MLIGLEKHLKCILSLLSEVLIVINNKGLSRYSRYHTEPIRTRNHNQLHAWLNFNLGLAESFLHFVHLSNLDLTSRRVSL
jgi:hypothetical protein